MMTEPTHSPDGFEIMYEREDGWCDWVHPARGYRMQCCDCGLVHDMQFQLVSADAVEGIDQSALNPGETKAKVILFRAKRQDTGAAA